MLGTVAILILVLVGAILYLRSRRHLGGGQRVVRIRLGRATETLGPGGVAIAVPFIDRLAPVPEGRHSFRGKTKAVLASGLEIEPAFEGYFTIRDAVAAFQGIPVFSVHGIPVLRELEPYVVGSLVAQLEAIAPAASEAEAASTSRFADRWQAAANAQLQSTGIAIEDFSIRNLGLPAHLAAEWALRAYEREQGGEPPAGASV